MARTKSTNQIISIRYLNEICQATFCRHASRIALLGTKTFTIDVGMKNLFFSILFLCLLFSCQGQSQERLMAEGRLLAQQGNFRGAIVVYKNLLEKYPSDATARRALVDAYLRTAKLEQAAEELATVTRFAPDAPDTLVLTARVRNAENKPDQALEVLQPLLSTPAAPAEAWEQAGTARLLQSRFGEAQAQFEKALSLAPTLAVARLGLATSLIQQQQLERAKTEIETLLRTSPKDRAALYLLLQLELQAHDTKAASEIYDTLADAYPADLRARYGQAFARLTQKNDLAFAEATATDLIQKNTKAPEGYKLKGLVALMRKQYPQALTSLLQALKFRQDTDTHIFLAQTYLSLGNLETAADHLQAVISAVPDATEPRRMLASIYMRQNRLDEALSEINKLLDKAPNDAVGERLLGDTLVAKHEITKGLEIFSKLSEQEGQPPVVHLKKGLLLSMQGEDAAAEKELRKAIDLAGNNLEPRLYLSRFLASKNRLDEAVDILGQGDARGPNAALSRNAMAKLRLQQGHTDQARTLLEEAKRLSPETLITYYNLATLHIAQGELAQAVSEFDAALAVNPTDQRALMGAAGCREALGDQAGARELLERATKSQSPSAYLQLAQFLIRRHDNAGALDAVEKCLSIAPNLIPAWQLKARLLATTGDQEKTLAALNSLETIQQRTGLLEKAKYYLSLNQPEKALGMATKLRELNKQSGDYHLPLAEIQVILKQLPAARESLQNALREDPDNPRVLAALADVENRLGHTEAALALLDRAMAAGMDPATGQSVQGAIQQQAGDVQAATAHYEKALRYKSEQPLALNNLAMLYADQHGHEAQALEMALQACALLPGDPAALDTLGYTLLKNNRGKDALKVLERAKTLRPDNADIEKHYEMARDMTTSTQ